MKEINNNYTKKIILKDGIKEMSCEDVCDKLKLLIYKLAHNYNNCDECYFYGMDDPSLSQNVVKFECENFKMIKYYVDLYARKKRKKLKTHGEQL